MMRLKICLRVLNENTFIRFNYSHMIYSMILDKIRSADSEYAKEIHQSKDFKFFTFSELMIPKRRIDSKKGGIYILSEEVNLLVSSPHERFIRAFLSGIMCDPEITIGAAHFSLSNARILETPDLSKGIAILKTITPLVLSTKRNMDGKLRSWNLMPEDNKFYENLRRNIIRKYEMFHGRKPSEDKFDLKVIKPLRPKRIKVKNEFHTGSRMIFEASGSPELLEFAYECGLGEKNSMGFGMVVAV